jgi:hypothetical protein
MIPKKIHYCWLSGEEMPNSIKQCMDSWKKILPEYEIIRWDMSRFDVNSSVFVSEAVRERKWAFASDYIRLYAIYTEGGIYFDTDVIVRKTMNEFLSHRFFSAVEYHPSLVENCDMSALIYPDGTSRERNTHKPGIGLQAAVMGGVSGHPFLRDCLDFYQDRHYIGEDGQQFNTVIAPGIFAKIAEDYGFRYKDEEQTLDEDMFILPSVIIASSERVATGDAYAIHCCEGSWRQGSGHWEHSKLVSAQLRIKKRMPKLYALAKLARKWVVPA